MKAMILAAGRGERMRPLTDVCPKSLLPVGGRPLIEHLLLKLRAAGIQQTVINLAYLGAQIRDTLGDGRQFELSITYSDEGEHALDTAGGIIKALPLLGDNPFIVVNADVWTDFDFAELTTFGRELAVTDNSSAPLARLVMVNNPSHHPAGDFVLHNDELQFQGESKLTYSGIGIYSSYLFKHQPVTKQPLLRLLKTAMQAKRVRGLHYTGQWFDIGTPDRLHALQRQLSQA